MVLRAGGLRGRGWAALALLACAAGLAGSSAYDLGSKERSRPFEPLDPVLPTPNELRLATGAPGPAYWQQRVDYEIEAELDDDNQRIYGSQKVTYRNNSPHELGFIWFQLDQNRLRPDSLDWRSRPSPVEDDAMNFRTMRQVVVREELRQAGFKITRVADAQGNAYEYTIVDTGMRVDLPRALPPQSSVEIHIDWAYDVVDAERVRARAGYERFEEDGNYIYEIAQWYPRAAAYTDYTGWQNRPFLGTSEFTLEFGDFLVKLTVPADHVVAATGELQNPEQVLTSSQRRNLQAASQSAEPKFVISPDEARANQRGKSKQKKTWVFQAFGVRDFAFASSRKFIWDAAGVRIGGQWVTAMSFYPPEALSLWRPYSTRAVVHALKVYSRYAFDYPYPVAISVNGPVGGMEYPMLSFNKPRPYADGSYWGNPWEGKAQGTDDAWQHSKYGLISVIIHEVGHNYFPMVVNSDERRWTWLDEGINTFIQYLAEVEWEEDYPSRRGPADSLTDYMRSPYSVPIMSSGDTILQRGNNAYAKPATALNVLREVVLGRELFDQGLRAFSQRWKFKRPTPADLFRTFEDVAGLDLDWFWRGWFYTTDYVDVEVRNLRQIRVDTRNPDTEAAWERESDEALGPNLSEERNAQLPKAVEADRALVDFYTRQGPYGVISADRKDYRDEIGKLDAEWQELLQKSDRLFYEVTFVNHGGLVTPLPLTLHYTNGATQDLDLPAQIWRYDDRTVRRLLVTSRPLQGVEFDAKRATSDVDTRNNSYPRRIAVERIELEEKLAPDNPLRKSKKK